MVPSKKFLNLFSDVGLAKNIQGMNVFSYVLDDSQLKFTRLKPVLSTSQDDFAYSTIANISPYECAKEDLVSRVKPRILSLNGSIANYVVDQAITLRDSFPYVNKKNSLPVTMDEIGVDGFENVCRHIVIENSLSFEQNDLSHRFVNGETYVSELGRFKGHSIMQIQNNDVVSYFDPTRIGSLSLEGVSRDELVKMVQSGNLGRPFNEGLRLEGKEEIGYSRMQEILNTSEYFVE
jgi:hypothetical protein